MNSKQFVISDVLGFGWNVMKTYLWFFVGVMIVFQLFIQVPEIVKYVTQQMHLGTGLYLLATLVGVVISIVLTIGIMKISLAFCDSRKPAFSELFDPAGCFWRYLGTYILYVFIIGAGFVLLIIPGIIWAVKFSLCFYFVIDKGLGPVDALKASSRTTMGVKWDLFGFGILCGLINIAGILCLIVGIFAAYPTTLVASSLVYRQLIAQTPELAEFGINTPKTEPIEA